MAKLLSGRTAGTLVFGVWAAFLIAVLTRSYLRPDHHSVYPIFANAAREWQQGLDLYDFTIARESLDKFRYAPIVAVSFIPFAAMPDALGGSLWRLVNLAVLFFGMTAFARSVFPGRASLNPKAIIILAGLLFPLSLGSINNGQSNTLIVGLLLLGTACTADKRWNLAAMCFAVPVLFKVYPMALVALVLLVEPRLVWRVGVAVMLACLLPLAAQEPSFVAQEYQSWINQVSSDNRHTGSLENSYRDFHLLTRLAGMPLEEPSYRVLQLAMFAGVACVVLRLRRRGSSKVQPLRAAFDLGACWIIMFGPATENCTYALLAPTMALAVWECHQADQPAWHRVIAKIAMSLFVVAVVVSATPIGKSVSIYLMPVGGLLLFAERVARYSRHTREIALDPSASEPMPQTV